MLIPQALYPQIELCTRHFLPWFIFQIESQGTFGLVLAVECDDPTYVSQSAETIGADPSSIKTVSVMTCTCHSSYVE
jgi:hypothetical protein